MLRAVSLLVPLVLLLMAPAAAVSVTLPATEIGPGEPVQVFLSGLPDGSRFSLATEGIFQVLPGEQLRFQLTNLTLPFSLSGGEILVTTENTRQVAFRVKKGDITTTLEAFPENGTFSKRESRNISAGVYPFMLLEADPLSPDQPVQARIQLQGETQGIQDTSITFSIEGIDAGEVAIIVTVDGERYLDERITIGGRDEIRSPDGRAFLEGIPGATLVMGDNRPLPEGWIPMGRCYSVVPDDLVFSSPATLTLVLPDLPEGSTPFIVLRTGETLQLLPGRVKEWPTGTVISTLISEPGEFCLVASVPPGQPSPPTQAPLPVIICSVALVFVSLISFRYKP